MKNKILKKKETLLLIICMLPGLLSACGKDIEKEPIPEGTDVPIVYESDEVSLCQYKGNVVTGYTADSYVPTEEEISQRVAEVCMYAAETSGEYMEYTDEWVASHFSDISTLEELKEAAKESLVTEAQMDAPYDNRQAAVMYVVEHSTVNASEKTKESAREQLLSMHKRDAVGQGYESFVEYLKKTGYESEEDFLESEFFKSEVDNAVSLSLVARAVAESEGIIVTEEQIDGYAESIKEGIFADREAVRNYLLEQAAYDLIYDNTIFTMEEGKESTVQ